MKNEFKKKNGFPTRYGYACGYGKEEMNGNNRKTIFEDDSHNCIDVKYTVNGEFTWKQFYHEDEGSFSNAVKKAESLYKSIKI